MPCEVEFETIVEMIERLTVKFSHTDRPVLLNKVDGVYQGISFAEFRRQIEQFANGLASLGVHRGDNIAVISENRPEWPIADVAMISLGAVNVPLYTTLSPKQVEFIFNDAGVKVAIVSNQLQLNKVLKIIDNVPTIKRIVIFTDKTPQPDERIQTFSAVLKSGKQFKKDNPHHVDEERRKVKPEDLITVIYTSGTTGNPKGVMLTHRNLVSNVKAALTAIPITKDDVMLSYLPMCHSFERMAGYYTPLSCGASIAYAENIDSLRDNMIEIRPTIMTTVPVLLERIYNRIMKQMSSASPLKQRIFSWALDTGRTYARARRTGKIPLGLKLARAVADLLVFRKIRSRTGGRLQFFASGGAALAKELGEFYESIGVMVIEGYGLTESSPVISCNRLDSYKFGTVGQPIPGVRVKIAPDGEILIQGPNVMRGYWKNPRETALAIDADGWLRTGDIGHIDEEGFLAITDRKKHLFVSSGGKNIAPQPIESLFVQCQYVSQFVLIGDRRMFCSALIVPDLEAVGSYAAAHHIRTSTPEELLRHKEVIGLFDREINRLQKDLSQYERVRKFMLLPAPLTIESGELTPTLKVKRQVVEEKYKEAIDKMYAGIL